MRDLRRDIAIKEKAFNSTASAVASAETDLTAIQDEVSDANGNIEAGIESIASLEKNRKSLQSRLTAAEGEVARLTAQLSAAQEK